MRSSILYIAVVNECLQHRTGRLWQGARSDVDDADCVRRVGAVQTARVDHELGRA